MNLYTSDMHFGHKNILNYDHRPFADTHEMEQGMIALWNNRVQPDDHVYILGDFSYKADHEPEWYLRQMKGHKHLIVGNHDEAIMNSPKAQSYFESIDNILTVSDTLNGENVRCVLCHYPIAEWDGFFRGAYHIYGHIHVMKNASYEFMRTQERALNAGCMINNYAPASLSELIRNNVSYRQGF